MQRKRRVLTIACVAIAVAAITPATSNAFALAQPTRNQSSLLQEPTVNDFATQIAYDSFDTVDAQGLSSASMGGSYTTYGDASTLSVGGGAAKITGLRPGRSVGATLMSTSTLNASVKSTVLVPSLSQTDLYVALEARKQPDGSAYRGRVKIAKNGALSVGFSRTAAVTETLLGSKSIPATVSANQQLNIEFRVSGSWPTILQIRAWKVGAAIPSWQHQYLDKYDALSGPGAVGLWAHESSMGTAATFAFNDWSAYSFRSQKPDATNTGVAAGVQLTRYSGPYTITTDGTIIDGAAIYGDLRIQAKNVVIRNSYLHCGSAIPSSNTGCIDANHANVYNLRIENNLIRPDYPSYYRDGIVGHEFTALGNHITRTNDGIGIFNRASLSTEANVRVENNYIHDMTYWTNDPAHTDGTHNDGIEVQGGENVTIRYNNVVGSVVAGDGLGVFGSHAGSALIVVQNVAKIANMIVEDNWFDDGQNSVCIQNKKYSTITLTMQRNYFGRNQYQYPRASTYQIRIYSESASTVYGLLNNRWEDTNALLSVGRDSGIRFNGA